LVVGALAVSWHGFPATQPISILDTPQQNQRGTRSAGNRQFGFGSLGISTADLTVPGKVIQLGFEPTALT